VQERKLVPEVFFVFACKESLVEQWNQAFYKA
jgi:hypothetical protein